MNVLNPLALVTIGAISAFLAKKRGKNPVLWFFLGMLFGVFGIFFLFFQRPPSNSHPYQNNSRNTDPNTLDITPKLASLAKKDFWYYLDDKKNQVGPLSQEKLVENYKKGEIKDNTYVWNDTLEDWKRIEDLF